MSNVEEANTRLSCSKQRDYTLHTLKIKDRIEKGSSPNTSFKTELEPCWCFTLDASGQKKKLVTPIDDMTSGDSE